MKDRSSLHTSSDKIKGIKVKDKEKEINKTKEKWNYQNHREKQKTKIRPNYPCFLSVMFEGVCLKCLHDAVLSWLWLPLLPPDVVRPSSPYTTEPPIIAERHSLIQLFFLYKNIVSDCL